jgi:general nucleoside transport system permease protein
VTGRAALGPLLALLGTLITGALLLLATGHDPVEVGRIFVERTLGRRSGIEESLVAMAPILIAALSAWVAARVGLWNIGIDGQVTVGALAAGALAPALDGLPKVAMWLLVALAGMLAGALWALLPAVLRARSGVNEIVTTIMMTYVAFSLASWLIKGPLKDESIVAPATESIAIARRLPHLGDTRVHAGVVVAVLLALLAWALARWTVPGILSRLVGDAPAAAGRLAVPVTRYVVAAFLLSGAVAALAGVSEVLAVRGSMQGDWRPALGLPAFAALFLARRHAAWLVPAAFLLGLMAYASSVLPRSADLAPDFFPLLEGVLLIFLAVGEWWRRTPRGEPAETVEAVAEERA